MTRWYWLWAKVYDSVLDKVFAFDRQAAISAAKIKPHHKVLELGIGTGLNIPFYPRCELHGVDLSTAMLDKAKHKRSHADVHLYNASADMLPFRGNTFDTGIATFVFRVLPDHAAALKELDRVIKPKGTLVVVDQFGLPSSYDAVGSSLGWGQDFDEDSLEKYGWMIKSKELLHGKTAILTLTH
jgi:phosphatidylethanolamine/phosphatidyl-N-methylethanolamine N-methyltransferase